MDTLLIISGIILIIAGIAGCALPVLPGPPLSYAGLLLLHFTGKFEFTGRFLLIWALITVAVTLVDYLIPVWGARKFGASRPGVWGSIIGLLVGMIFFPPFGIIAGPFLGAVAGELLSGKNTSQAFKAGFGSFIGFLAGVMLKLTTSGLMTWHFFRTLFGQV